MIQVTDKYAISILPECYAVAVFRGIAKKDGKGYKEGERIYVGNWYYPSLEGALLKISSLIEKDNADGCRTLISAVESIKQTHAETRKLIRTVVEQYANGINN